ncbi:MAG TPA: thiamine diphosphokinase [Microthrixaceae bacterium]|nr:thiamine diphosphokinase [Microthrixaceae bacterium]
MKTAVVFAAGPLGRVSFERLRGHVDALRADVLVAADGGLDLAYKLGCEPDLVIGDMDSVTPDSLAGARRSGVEIREFARAKDATDYELAIDAAVAAGAERVTVVGSESGRIDHLFATLMTLCAPKYASVAMEAVLGDSYLAVLNGADDTESPAALPALAASTRVGSGPNVAAVIESESDTNVRGRSRVVSPSSVILEGPSGSSVSLFAMNGAALGISTTGLAWALEEAKLEPGSSLGVSNEIARNIGTVRITTGCLAVVMPASAESKEVK